MKIIASLLAAVLAIALAVVLTAGCATTTTPSSVTLDGIIADGQRVADAGETGLVRVYRDGAWVEGQAHMSLRAGDLVATGPRGYAVIRYPSGTEVFMRPDSRGRIGSFTDLVGEVFAKIRGAFAIETEFVKAGAEGTAYLVRAAPNGEATVVVFDGTVAMSSRRGAWAPYRMAAGAMSVTRAQGIAPSTMRATAEELAWTRGWVERMETLAPPPRQLNKAGTALAIGALVAIIAASHASGDSPPDHDTPALAAPARATPGIASADKPAALYNCGALTLAWLAVPGAHDYAVTLDAASDRGPWRTLSTSPSSETRMVVGQLLQMNTLYRWFVRARDARGHAGAATAPLYFACRSNIR